jgi:beta-N-acetylhexosaminidase
LRAAHPWVIAVDMGWPSDDRKYADIATFGASRLVGRALTEYLAGSRS